VLYVAMFGDQDKPWAPHIFCKACAESLRKWTKSMLKILSLVNQSFGENRKAFPTGP